MAPFAVPFLHPLLFYLLVPLRGRLLGRVVSVTVLLVVSDACIRVRLLLRLDGGLVCTNMRGAFMVTGFFVAAMVFFATGFLVAATAGFFVTGFSTTG